MAVALRARRPPAQKPGQLKPGNPTPQRPAGPVGMQDKHKWIILVGLITSAVLEVMDTTIVNVALPRMSGNFGATLEESPGCLRATSCPTWSCCR